MLGGKGENLGKYNRQRLNKNRGKRMVLPAKKMECFEILIIRSLSHFFYANMVVYGVLLLLKHAEKLSCPEYGRVVLQNTRHVFMMGQLCIMVSRTSTKRTSSIDHKNTNEGILQGLG
jgi:hypothetical protein